MDTLLNCKATISSFLQEFCIFSTLSINICDIAIPSKLVKFKDMVIEMNTSKNKCSVVFWL